MTSETDSPVASSHRRSRSSSATMLLSCFRSRTSPLAKLTIPSCRRNEKPKMRLCFYFFFFLVRKGKIGSTDRYCGAQGPAGHGEEGGGGAGGGRVDGGRDDEGHHWPILRSGEEVREREEETAARERTKEHGMSFFLFSMDKKGCSSVDWRPTPPTFF